jgi:hypothetical protein
MPLQSNYENNVFINCPFDDDYQKLFNAILFTVHKCGFILRCSKEFEDSNSVRIKNILNLIRESKYAIHDLSRVEFDLSGDLPRFNMPLELGIFIGCIEFGGRINRKKEYLIIESEQFRFKQFISDLSGQDIKAHKDDVKTAISCIRNWLAKKTKNVVPSPGIIFREYQIFLSELPDLASSNQWLQDELTFEEYSSLVSSWLTVQS